MSYYNIMTERLRDERHVGGHLRQIPADNDQKGPVVQGLVYSFLLGDACLVLSPSSSYNALPYFCDLKYFIFFLTEERERKH